MRASNATSSRSASSSSSVKVVFTTMTSTTLSAMQYFMDIWKDPQLRKRCSLQMVLPSGNNPVIRVRVSASGWELVITLVMNTFMTSAELAFNSYTLNRDVVKNDMSGNTAKLVSDIMTMHPKIITRCSMLEKLKKERSEHLIDEFRLKLPFPVENRYVNESEDPNFNGINIHCYPDGSKHMHVKLLGRQQGSYSLTSADDMSVKSTAEIPLYPTASVPGSVSIGQFPASPYRSSSRRQSDSNSTICSNLSTLSNTPESRRARRACKTPRGHENSDNNDRADLNNDDDANMVDNSNEQT